MADKTTAELLQPAANFVNGMGGNGDLLAEALNGLAEVARRHEERLARLPDSVQATIDGKPWAAMAPVHWPQGRFRAICGAVSPADDTPIEMTADESKLTCPTCKQKLAETV